MSRSSASLGAAAVAAAIISQRQTTAAQREEAKRLRAAQEQLGAFLAEGIAPRKLAHQEDQPAPTVAANTWRQSRLVATLGSAFVARFADGSGLPSPFVNRIRSQEHKGLENGLRIKTARLQQFLSELTPAHLK